MKSKLSTGFLCLLFFASCQDPKSTDPNQSDTDVNAARSFIRAALDGDYKTAKNLILPDSTNQQYLEAFSGHYQTRMSQSDRIGYRQASINIHNLRTVNDSTTIVNYSNSYKQQNDSLMVVRQGAGWRVDLKYSFAPIDSLP